MKKNRVALIIPFFGKFPVWMELFLYSCSRNSNIDFIFYTDCVIPSLKYPNTIFHSISFKDYCLKVSQCLGIQFVPKASYKLCDLKCFYGVIHKDELSNYEFWGFGDLDLVYGDLSMFVNSKSLRKYDLLTTHADRIAGHFTLIRTKSKYTEYCFRIPNWRRDLESERICGLDEIEFTKLVYPFVETLIRIQRGLSKFLRIKIQIYDFLSIPNAIRNIFSKIYIKEYYTSELPKKGQIWSYDLRTGKILNWRNEEIPYLHFLFFKKTPYWDTDTYWKEGFWQVPELKSLSNTGFIYFDNQKVIYSK